MSSHRDSTEPLPPAHFPEAVAQWRLAVRTEVKRSSALPSSMFDACDPMLEMRLAESTEAMLACLHEPSAPVVQPPPDGGERRVERVTIDELRTLPSRLAGDADAETGLDVDTDLDREAIVVLADACCCGHEAAAAGAALLLRARGAVDAVDAAEHAAAALRSRLEQVIPDSALASDDLAAVCRRIVAVVRQHAADTPGATP